MKLPTTVRDAILEEVDTYVDAVDEPSTETVVEYVMEQLETIADELEIDDLFGSLEESGQLDLSLSDALTEAFSTKAGFVFTGEDVVSTLEELCAIRWS